MLAAFQHWHGIVLYMLAQTNVVIIEVSWDAKLVENEGVIWYDFVRPFC